MSCAITSAVGTFECCGPSESGEGTVTIFFDTGFVAGFLDKPTLLWLQQRMLDFLNATPFPAVNANIGFGYRAATDDLFPILGGSLPPNLGFLTAGRYAGTSLGFAADFFGRKSTSLSVSKVRRVFASSRIFCTATKRHTTTTLETHSVKWSQAAPACVQTVVSAISATAPGITGDDIDLLAALADSLRNPATVVRSVLLLQAGESPSVACCNFAP